MQPNPFSKLYIPDGVFIDPKVLDGIHKAITSDRWEFICYYLEDVVRSGFVSWAFASIFNANKITIGGYGFCKDLPAHFRAEPLCRHRWHDNHYLRHYAKKHRLLFLDALIEKMEAR